MLLIYLLKDDMKEQFGLYLILTDPVAGYEACARAAVDCGVRYVQLRMKNGPHDRMIDTAHRLRDITGNTETRLIINDDLSVAIASDADGIHLGQTDLSISEARATWPIAGKIFGLSTHSMDQAARALKQNPDYIGVGPVFPTMTKTDADPDLGAEETGRIIRETPVTAVAIGGIHAGNLSQVLEQGITNFCVVSAVNSSADPAAAIRKLQEIWKGYHF